MLPQPIPASTDALKRLGTGLWTGAPPAPGAGVTPGQPQPDATVQSNDPPAPREAVWQSSPTEGVAPPPPGAGVDPGQHVMSSSPTEGVAPPQQPQIMSSSPTEGVAPPAGAPAPASTAPPFAAFGRRGMAAHGMRGSLGGLHRLSRRWGGA